MRFLQAPYQLIHIASSFSLASHHLAGPRHSDVKLPPEAAHETIGKGSEWLVGSEVSPNGTTLTGICGSAVSMFFHASRNLDRQLRFQIRKQLVDLLCIFVISVPASERQPRQTRETPIKPGQP